MDEKWKKMMELILSDVVVRADAIVCLEGDGQERTKKALEIFIDGLASQIIVSGGYDNPPFSIVASKMAEYLIQGGVPKEKIIIEENSKNTKEQAEQVMKIAKNKKLGKLILVASDFHQPRAYLTFLKAMHNEGLKLLIMNAPVIKQPVSDEKLVQEEFKKIKEYGKKGHVSTISQALTYQKWKQKQI